MDFELISGPGSPARQPLRELEFFFINRKRQWQLWLSQPPFVLAAAVFGVVVFELFVARLLTSPAPRIEWPGRFFATAAAIFVVQGALVLIASQIGDLFDKKGSPLVALTLLSVGLVPLLLFLPATVAIRMAGGSPALSMLVLILLVARVLSFWREALEATFKFSRFQSAAVLYSAFSLAIGLLIFIVYVFLAAQLSGVLSGL